MSAKAKKKATPAETSKDWTKPSSVTGLDVAFGGRMKDLLPPMEDIPDEYKGHHPQGDATRWRDLQSQWFYEGLKGEFVAKAGIDRGRAMAHLKAIQGSWDPKHEHKIAAVSWLMSLWFSDYIEAAK